MSEDTSRVKCFFFKLINFFALFARNNDVCIVYCCGSAVCVITQNENRCLNFEVVFFSSG